jgi:hypothetical protein
MLQDNPGWIPLLHPFFLIAKSPVIVTLLTTSCTPPVLVMTALFALLVVPTVRAGKLRDGVTVAEEPMPSPLMPMLVE